MTNGQTDPHKSEFDCTLFLFICRHFFKKWGKASVNGVDAAAAAVSDWWNCNYIFCPVTHFFVWAIGEWWISKASGRAYHLDAALKLWGECEFRMGRFFSNVLTHFMIPCVCMFVCLQQTSLLRFSWPFFCSSQNPPQSQLFLRDFQLFFNSWFFFLFWPFLALIFWTLSGQFEWPSLGAQVFGSCLSHSRSKILTTVFLKP